MSIRILNQMGKPEARSLLLHAAYQHFYEDAARRKNMLHEDAADDEQVADGPATTSFALMTRIWMPLFNRIVEGGIEGEDTREGLFDQLVMLLSLGESLQSQSSFRIPVSHALFMFARLQGAPRLLQSERTGGRHWISVMPAGEEALELVGGVDLDLTPVVGCSLSL